MTDSVQVALIVSTAPTLGVLWAIWLGIRNGKKTDAVKEAVDGRFTELRHANDRMLTLLLEPKIQEGITMGKQAERETK